MLFFILFYLALLSMSSLPVWRDEYILFAHERASNVYGNLSYYISIVMFDLVLVRVVPPFSFAFISYQWMDLQEYCHKCLYDFVIILGTMRLELIPPPPYQPSNFTTTIPPHHRP